MFKTVIPGGSYYDEVRNVFLDVPSTPIQLEHSLLSISRWESKWNRSYFNDGPKTEEEKLDYIKDMTITQNVNPLIYKVIPNSVKRQIELYCASPMTATTISRKAEKPHKRAVITSELVYFWMITYGIPFECEKWHLNRLMTLIEICSIKNTPPKKMSQKDLIAHHRAVNAQRRSKKG